MQRLFLAIFLFLCLISFHSFAQGTHLQVDSLLRTRGEVYFSFFLNDMSKLNDLSSIVSIDQVKDGRVHAYANRKEWNNFLSLGIEFQLLTPPGCLIPESELRTAMVSVDVSGRTIWNFYPTYDQYLGFMAGFASSYPAICKLDTIGLSIQGRLLLAVKISDNVNNEESEPQFFYTSSIHGDELTAYVEMLHLIDYLLLNYGIDPRITDLVNNTEIYINPLANPDGTYHGGNNTVYGAIRYNANNIDLNRNYPDPEDGPHPDGNPWQMETEAFMAYAGAHSFIMSANFHGGAEVFNYPWDTWATLHADDDWWQFTGREWADTVHQYAPPGYFDDLQNGITNGYQWYTINGGRQDYMNYWHSCREVTIEISQIKIIPTNQLINFWNWNWRSFLNYIEQANYGFHGIITDTVTGSPLVAKVLILGHDVLNSHVFSRLPHGYYSRPIFEGNWMVTFSADGYFSKYITIPVSKWNTTHVDVQLRPHNFGSQDHSGTRILVYPNPADGHLQILLPFISTEEWRVGVLTLQGNLVQSYQFKTHLSQHSLVLNPLPSGLYLIKLENQQYCWFDKIIMK